MSLNNREVSETSQRPGRETTARRDAPLPTPPDIEQRRRAAYPSGSFLVQAPAGSGKTTLLVERFLALLAHVSSPEEILAITFTRKAAKEMRSRVLKKLAHPQDDVSRGALEHNARKGWDLLANPQRLKIQTIDSFAYSLVQRLPYASRLGLDYQTLDSASIYYSDAASGLIQSVLSPQSLNQDVICFLADLVDNDFDKAVKLVADMLQRRDQWIGVVSSTVQAHVGDATPVWVQLLKTGREFLVQSQVEEFLEAMETLPGTLENMLDVCRRSAEVRKEKFGELTKASNARLLANLFLTSQGNVRKRVDKRHGFPAQSSLKDDWTSCKQAIETETRVQETLRRLQVLPDEIGSPLEQDRLVKTAVVLSLANNALTALFEARKVVDFTELAAGATRALRSDEAPTELIQALDYRISHILVDEFQDTSHAQRELFEALIQGWQVNDGNTFFAVGDPMQSIYRFRNADVGIYLDAREAGMGQRALTNIELTTNFRSAPELIEWNNRVYQSVFKPYTLGAVPFNTAESIQSFEGSIRFQVFRDDPESHAQARAVAERVKELREADPGQSIALLIRSRTKLPVFLAAMRELGVPWAGVDIEKLSDVAVVRDLHAICSALYDDHDKLAWLSLLKSPLCGLALPQIEKSAEVDTGSEMLSLSFEQAHDQLRVNRVRNAVDAARADRTRTFRSVLERLWFQLGGPDAYVDQDTVENAERYLDLLESESKGAPDPAAIWKRTEELYASQQSPDAHVEIMTIHKSKGLEFDHVILPDLDHGPSTDAKELLMFKRPEKGLLMATLKDSDDEHSLYAWLRKVDREEEESESMRVLYVATTRAVRSLSLYGSLKPGANDIELSAPPKSLLRHLANSVARQSIQFVDADEAENQTDGVSKQVRTRRLCADYAWTEPPAPMSNALNASVPVSELKGAQVDAIGVNEDIAVGNLVHRILYDMGRETGVWPATEHQIRIWTMQLRQEGLDSREARSALSLVLKQIQNVLDDPDGRWILSNDHEESGFERRYETIVGGQLATAILDRTFVDSEGCRWIIDYKSGERGTRSEILQRKYDTDYLNQLQRYTDIVGRVESRPIRAGIYFTSLPLFVEYPIVMPDRTARD